MKKEFIKDDEKVRECISNIAKMNIFEWMYYRREIILRTFFDALYLIVEGSSKLIFGLIQIWFIILFPITFPIGAYINIRNAKKEIKIKNKCI